MFSTVFHIVAKMNKALDELRVEESRRMATEGRVPLLRKSRWLLPFSGLWDYNSPAWAGEFLDDWCR